MTGSAGESSTAASHVQGRPDFTMIEELALPYGHMGATITHAVLQAGLRYETVVWPESSAS